MTGRLAIVQKGQNVFGNMPKWMKVALSGLAVLWILSTILAPVGDGTKAVGDALGKVIPSIGTGLRTSSRSVHNTFCGQSGRCATWPGA